MLPDGCCGIEIRQLLDLLLQLRRAGGREGGSERGKEGGREGERERGREGERVRGREGGRRILCGVEAPSMSKTSSGL